MGDLAQVPKVPTVPWLGAAWSILREGGPYLLRCYRRQGPIFRTAFLGGELVHLVGPRANEIVLDTSEQSFSHAEGYAMVRKLFGDGLLFQDGSVQRRNRALLSPSFSARAVERLFEVMHLRAAVHLRRWASEGPGSMYERFRLFTADIAVRLMLGVTDDEHVDRLADDFAHLGKGAAALVRVGVGPLSYAEGVRARDRLRRSLAELIRRWPKHVPCDGLGALIRARAADGDVLLGESELVDQAITLIFAGHETTTSMLCSALSSLEAHGDIREALIAEQRRLGSNGDLSVQQLREMLVLDRFLREVERLWPPVYVAQRGVVRDVEVDGCLLPAGTQVTYSPFVSHRVPEVFAEPEAFRPDRFAPGRAGARTSQAALVGFGGGPRRCLGYGFAQQEMKVALALLLRGYRCIGLESRPRLGYVPTIHPRCGLPARIVPLH